MRGGGREGAWDRGVVGEGEGEEEALRHLGSCPENAGNALCICHFALISCSHSVFFQFLWLTYGLFTCCQPSCPIKAMVLWMSTKLMRSLLDWMEWCRNEMCTWTCLLACPAVSFFTLASSRSGGSIFFHPPIWCNFPYQMSSKRYYVKPVPDARKSLIFTPSIHNSGAVSSITFLTWLVVALQQRVSLQRTDGRSCCCKQGHCSVLSEL